MGETNDPSSLRVGHAERDAVTQALVSHLVAGRLSLPEFEQRVRAATEARTRGDLSALFHDLPEPHGMAGTGGPSWARLPDALRTSLAAENLVALAEELTGSITYRRYRAGGVEIRRREVSIVGAVAVSKSRLVVWTSGSKHVDVPFTHPLWLALTISAERSRVLRISYRAEAFRSDRSGRVDLRLATDRAVELAHAAQRRTT
ncbi:DUF1707 SHOCT-like domain-containing protein [Kibdelosporangium aridum]|uniref:DUF1707 domain-containing protein n=1 Tax=Kibdelosporangium aridum TaxID=2030 RepID=A0A1W2FM66_KIBAR|nr:DUF1707 domain-containing protein [Kibdelosporangium aridum]SMD22970.1 protein of unknown function [Kibdelosporangium aridum]